MSVIVVCSARISSGRNPSQDAGAPVDVAVGLVLVGVAVVDVVVTPSLVDVLVGSSVVVGSDSVVVDLPGPHAAHARATIMATLSLKATSCADGSGGRDDASSETSPARTPPAACIAPAPT
ncbi:hypothetical protein OV079_35925 [Nannocystis pusilla]|uniref:Uncharacterized protein n=1 Tax=Nannocystis pusilla TaxID=889268 RepID=A0A9X3F3L1_9BACT|nr:hypothetical protein [Nannocystis pusilla]MCY1010863.1 hypothetical protein [Nannocystis pusilla]